MPRIPAIKSVMSPFPHSIEAGAMLEEARWMLSAHGIRHLPVTRQGRLVGILSSRDVDRAHGRDREGGAPPFRVEDICSKPPYAVELDEPIDNVLLHMAAERIGSALVLRGARVVGIFTTTDACRLFADYLRRDSPFSGDDAA